MSSRSAAEQTVAKLDHVTHGALYKYIFISNQYDTDDFTIFQYFLKFRYRYPIIGLWVLHHRLVKIKAITL